MMRGHARSQLDARQLERFHGQLSLAIDRHSRAIFEIPEQKTSALFFLELWKVGVLTTDDMHFLAGASGDIASQTDLEAGTWNPEGHCIFSGPKSGQALLKAMESEPNGEILFCYNRHYATQSDEIVVLFAGEKVAKSLTLEEICERSSQESGHNIDIPDVDNLTPEDIYKLAPFRNVAPE